MLRLRKVCVKDGYLPLLQNRAHNLSVGKSPIYGQKVQLTPITAAD